MVKTSFITRLSKNLLFPTDVAKSDEFYMSDVGDYQDEIVKKSLLTPKY